MEVEDSVNIPKTIQRIAEQKRARIPSESKRD